jgi:hypothetical protein
MDSAISDEEKVQHEGNGIVLDVRLSIIHSNEDNMKASEGPSRRETLEQPSIAPLNEF